MTMLYSPEAEATILNLTEFIYNVSGDLIVDIPVVEVLESGDLVLTGVMLSEDAKITSQYIIDAKTGEFVATHRSDPHD